MPKNLLLLTFEDDSVLSLRLRKSGGYVIYYEDSEAEETKLVSLNEDIDFDLAKSIFFLVADRWGWDEMQEQEDDEEEGQEEEPEEEP